MTDELADLEAKLRAREGLSGFRDNVEDLKRRISSLKASGTFRSTITGRFVTAEYARANPTTTYRGELPDGR